MIGGQFTVWGRGGEMDIWVRGYEELRRGRLCFLDTETTGLEDWDRVIEVSCCLVEGGELVGEYSSLVSLGDSGVCISESAKGVHGIGVGELEEFGVGIMDASECLRVLMTGSVVVGYNVMFDIERLLYTSGGYEYGYVGLMDLCRASRSRYRGLRSYGLRSVCEHLGIEVRGGYHRARYDVELLMRLWECLGEWGYGI